MALENAGERQDEIAVAIVRGRIDGNTTEQLQSELESGLGAEDAALIPDFEEVSCINGSGLRVSGQSGLSPHIVRCERLSRCTRLRPHRARAMRGSPAPVSSWRVRGGVSTVHRPR